MSEYVIDLWHILWTSPLYRGLMIAIAAELALVCGLIVWLWLQAGRQLQKDRAQQRFLDELEAPFFDALGDDDELHAWMQRAQSHPREFVRDFIADYLLQTQGHSHDTLVRLYHDFGYAADDHEQARSVSERKRLGAMRRLYVVATEADREVLLEHADTDYLSRILATQTLARVGTPEDVVAMLEGLDLSTQMMEAPIHAVLDELTTDQLRYVFTRWRQFESGRVRRILLIVAAEKNIEEVGAALEQAVQSDDMEVRIGACAAAGSLVKRDALDLLLKALEDPAWQVRARAAKALGRRREQAAIEPLAEALKDRAFWVRQDAAMALRHVGQQGLSRLQHVAENSDDRYAAESAGQELQRYRLFLETRGAPA
jgi:HEAT repeat protein